MVAWTIIVLYGSLVRGMRAGEVIDGCESFMGGEQLSRSKSTGSKGDGTFGTQIIFWTVHSFSALASMDKVRTCFIVMSSNTRNIKCSSIS